MTNDGTATFEEEPTMDKIRFMVVSGFLGAGKTTTMIALAEHMNKTYGETAIIANDLGANLVDTHLTQTSGCMVAEIASGCICYQMDNTIDQIRRLRDKDGAVFVMSDIPGCGVSALDHVYHRLAAENADEFTLSPFTVVVDLERLRMIMPEHADINLPEELVYLLKLQLEEADLIEGVRMGLIERKRNVPHLKLFATSGNGDFNKASLVGVDYDVEYAQKLLRPHKNLRMIVNARAVCESRPLARIMDDALDDVCDRYDLDCQVFFTECFGMADEGR